MSTARQQANVLVELLRRERDALAEFLVALAGFDRDRAWEALGHNSLFAFLVKDLGLSSGAAAYRKAAVELIQRFPRLLAHLRSGELCITTVFELSKVITDENAAEVLPRFFGTSKREAKNVVAELAPEPAAARTVVTAVAAPSLALSAPAAPAGRLADQVRANSEPPTQEVRDSQWNAATLPTVVEPKTAELSRVHVTVPRRLLEKLAAARDALSHSHPRAGDAEILEVGLDLVIERHRKRRGIGCKPRKPAEKAAAPAASAVPSAAPSVPPPPPPRKRSHSHVPAPVWREVWERDGGRCAWPLEGGGVCGSTRRIELDHIKGLALGAGSTVEECRLLCRPHQLVSARKLYGDELMDRYVRPKGGGCSEPVASYGLRVREYPATRSGSGAGLDARAAGDSCTHSRLCPFTPAPAIRPRRDETGIESADRAIRVRRLTRASTAGPPWHVRWARARAPGVWGTFELATGGRRDDEPGRRRPRRRAAAAGAHQREAPCTSPRGTTRAAAASRERWPSARSPRRS